MNMGTFLTLLFVFSTITGLIVECIKKIITDKVNISYNITALVVAVIVGAAGSAIYYQLNTIPFTTDNIIYMMLMGLTSALVSTLGYDKVIQALQQCNIIKEKK